MEQRLNMISDEEKYQRAKKIIYGKNVNITEDNPLKELVINCINAFIVVMILYFSLYFLSGIAISFLSDKQQQQIETFMANSLKEPKTQISNEDKEKLESIKKNILQVDKNFPKTSTFKVGLMDARQKNAFCLSNGTIYITLPLYSALKNDDELTFIMAHEMGHYKHKDHLLKLRRNIASSAVILFLSVTGGDFQHLSNFVNGSLGTAKLQFSRKEEEKADKYAAKVLKTLYGSTDAGVRAIKILNADREIATPEFLSTHPAAKRRIEYIKAVAK